MFFSLLYFVMSTENNNLKVENNIKVKNNNIDLGILIDAFTRQNIQNKNQFNFQFVLFLIRLYYPLFNVYINKKLIQQMQCDSPNAITP